MLQLKEALGYAAYIMFTTFLPNAVNVITLFVGESTQHLPLVADALMLLVLTAMFITGSAEVPLSIYRLQINVYAGGNLVLEDRMSAGSLVSFMLYVTSLNGALQVDPRAPLDDCAWHSLSSLDPNGMQDSQRVHVVNAAKPKGLHDSLQALADVFSAFAAALGAADKVIELIQRLPKMPDPGGLKPSSFSGHLELKDVEFSYPSRPDTRVLGGVSLSVKPGEASHRFLPMAAVSL